ncbi:MAG: hypothetical protein ACLGI5_08390 [Thermoleophilia bacterium]
MSRRSDSKASPGEAATAGAAGVCVAGHPRSAAAVRRAKGFGGLLGTLLTALLALQAGLPPSDAMLRGLAGGIVGYLALWAVALAVARQLVIAEVRTRYAELVRATAAGAADADSG